MTSHIWLFVWYQNLIFFIHMKYTKIQGIIKVWLRCLCPFWWMDWCQFNILSIHIMWIFINLNLKKDSSFLLQNIIFRFSHYLYALWYREGILEVCWGLFKLKSLNTSSFSKKPEKTTPKLPQKSMTKNQKRKRLLNYLRQWNILFNISCKVDWNMWWQI